MRRLIFLFSLLAFIRPVAAQVGDIHKLDELASKGLFELKRDRNLCARGVSLGGSLCVFPIDYSRRAQEEVAHMEKAQLHNESDFDQRVTSLLLLKRGHLKLEQLVKALNLGSKDSFMLTDSLLGYHITDITKRLFVGDYLKKDTHVHRLITKFISQAKSYEVFQMTEEVEVERGLIFTTSHVVIWAESKVLYFKLSLWDSV